MKSLKAISVALSMAAASQAGAVPPQANVAAHPTLQSQASSTGPQMFAKPDRQPSYYDNQASNFQHNSHCTNQVGPIIRKDTYGNSTYVGQVKIYRPGVQSGPC